MKSKTIVFTLVDVMRQNNVSSMTAYRIRKVRGRIVADALMYSFQIIMYYVWAVLCECTGGVRSHSSFLACIIMLYNNMMGRKFSSPSNR